MQASILLKISGLNHMKIAVTLFWIIVVALLLGLFSLNAGQTVDIDLLFTVVKQVNIITVIYVSVLAGFLLGLTFWLVRWIRGTKEEARLKKTIRQLNDEITVLKERPATEEAPRLGDAGAQGEETVENT